MCTLQVQEQGWDHDMEKAERDSRNRRSRNRSRSRSRGKSRGRSRSRRRSRHEQEQEQEQGQVQGQRQGPRAVAGQNQAPQSRDNRPQG